MGDTCRGGLIAAFYLSPCRQIDLKGARHASFVGRALDNAVDVQYAPPEERLKRLAAGLVADNLAACKFQCRLEDSAVQHGPGMRVHKVCEAFGQLQHCSIQHGGKLAVLPARLRHMLLPDSI